jgi:regulator of nucleoside diphosphate kinase
MSSTPDVLMSSNDIRVLHGLLFDPTFSADNDKASPDLWAKILDANVVRPHALPSDRVRLHSTVTYEELPSRNLRTVQLVTPRHADAGKGRISVLSPIGRALLGHAKGRVIRVALPIGRYLSIRVTEVTSPESEAVDESVAV